MGRPSAPEGAGVGKHDGSLQKNGTDNDKSGDKFSVLFNPGPNPSEAGCSPCVGVP